MQIMMFQIGKARIIDRYVNIEITTQFNITAEWTKIDDQIKTYSLWCNKTFNTKNNTKHCTTMIDMLKQEKLLTSSIIESQMVYKYRKMKRSSGILKEVWNIYGEPMIWKMKYTTWK